MNNKRTSPIWFLPEKDFKDLIEKSKRMKDVLNFFNLQNKGGNFKTVKKRIQELELDTSHFLGRQESSVFHRRMTEERFVNKMLVKGSETGNVHIKRYLLKFNLIEYKCKKCGNKGEWEGTPLSLQLEHNNGVSNDHRQENLSFLCPNCHSQTETFAGRNSRKQTCKFRKLRNTKIKWPPKKEFSKLLWEKPTSQIAKSLGVSDSAINKHCKKHGIIKPPRGYWTKKDY